MRINDIPAGALENLRRGTVIPAHPLALDRQRRFDQRRQRALTRYYLDAGAGGVAVGVHTTQFAIRDHGLYEPVLALAAETVDTWTDRSTTAQPPAVLKVAGVCGATPRATEEAGVAREHGYHACLLNVAALADLALADLLAHCREVAAIMPVFGFYLQAGIGGLTLPYRFWREFAEIDNVLAIKVAAFNRYQTLDVIRAVCDAGREKEIALYTGNDDSIVIDLLSTYRVQSAKPGDETRSARFVGGLLGHWAVWTRRAVEFLEVLRPVVQSGEPIPPRLLSAANEVTDANAAFFDAANGFSGCIPGIHEVLRRQGLLEGSWCLDPDETLSPGQADEIDRVCRSYPHWSDDDFVRENLDRWLA